MKSARQAAIGWIERRLWRAPFVRRALEALAARVPWFRHALDHRIIANSGLFDAAWYRERYEPIYGAIADPPAHYLRRGLRDQLDPNPHFSTHFYLRAHEDVALAGVHPLVHYALGGWRERRTIGARFDAAYYLAQNPEMAAAGLDPLRHFLEIGRLEGKHPVPPDHEAREVSPGVADFGGLNAPANEAALVDVIVPVYRDRAATLRCLHSVLASVNATPFALIVVDDASPEAPLSADLRLLGARGAITLLVNRQNMGFVAAVNRGMRLHPGRDVVLLNADAEVFGDWLDRLAAVLDRDASVGTVTPLSNNATILSYPRADFDNGPMEIAPAEIDRLARAVNAGVTVDLPTAVGFCMLLRRKCLEATGPFDEKTFGRGYGEENDFCLRAAARGWRHVAACDVFVRHGGGASFGAERPVRLAAAQALIDRRYPEYRTAVARFTAEDRLAPARLAIDLARLERRLGALNVLLITHDVGGGTEQHVQDSARELERQGRGAIVLRPAPNDPRRARVTHLDVANLANLPPIDLRDPGEATLRMLRRLRVQRAHVHHLLGWGAAAPAWVASLCAMLGVPYDVTIHDYLAICPRIHLVGRGGVYCGEPEPGACRACLKTEGSPYGVVDVVAWREGYGKFLRRAAEVFAPDLDVADRLRRYFPHAVVNVRPHREPGLDEAEIPTANRPGAPRRTRVVTLGALGIHKGAAVVEDCARAALANGAPIEFVVIGHTKRDARLRRLGVTVTGPYRAAEALSLLARHRPDVAFLPSVYPETFSYALSVLLRTDLPIVAFDLGAQGRRLRGHPRATLLPISLHDRPRAVLAALQAAARG